MAGGAAPAQDLSSQSRGLKDRRGFQSPIDVLLRLWVGFEDLGDGATSGASSG